MKKYISFIAIILLLGACSQVPDGVLDRKKMEKVLYEVHLAEGIIDEYPAKYRTSENKQKLMAGVFRDNGITKADFDSSMVYYGAHLDQYMKIYSKVTARLNADKELAASELLAYERSLLSPEGDSVNIWRKQPELILDPALLASTAILEVKGDSNFKANDHLVWNMRLQNMPADSLGYLYVAFGFRAKDSINQVTAIRNDNGWFTAELTLPQISSSDRVFGSVSLINRKDTLLAPVFIDSITWMRYRALTPAIIPADTLKQDTLKNDSIKVDSIK